MTGGPLVCARRLGASPCAACAVHMGACKACVHALQRSILTSIVLPSALTHTRKPPPLGAGPVTLRGALARYADLLSAPSKAALQALAAFASDPEEAARLRHMASIEGKQVREQQLWCQVTEWLTG